MVELLKDDLNELLKQLMDKQYTAKDLTAISYRTINYWGEQGFLIFEKSKEDRQWRKFSFAELLWINMLDEFRNLGVSIEKIAFHIKKHFGEHDFHPDERSYGAEIYDSKVVVKISEWETHLHFAWLLAITIFYKNPVSLRIFMDGTIREVFANPNFTGITVLETEEKDFESSFQPFISISIDKILLEVIPELNNSVVPYGIVTENEKELLRHLSKEEVNYVMVISPDDYQYELNFDGHKGNLFNSRVIQKVLRSGDYKKITYRTNGGKTAFFEQPSPSNS